MFYIVIIAILIGISAKQKVNIFGSLPPFLAGHSVDWPTLLVTFIWTSFSVDFVFLCYRFDYANARTVVVDDGADNLVSVRIHPVTAAVISDEDHPPFVPIFGVRVASEIDSYFAKPYYFTAIASWIAANVLVVLLEDYIEIEEYEKFGFYLSWLAPPLAGIAATFVALARGEFRTMWNYVERWAVPPTTGTSAGKAKSATIDKKPLLPVHEKGSS